MKKEGGNRSFKSHILFAFIIGCIKKYTRHIILPPLLIFFTLWISAFPISAQEIISPRTGLLHLAETDIELPGGPGALTVQRTFLNEAGRSGLLGTLWRLNWESNLFIIGSMAYIEDASGTIFFQKEEGTDEFQSLSGEPLVPGKEGRFIWTRRDRVRFVYGSNGRLIEKVDANGNRTELLYDDNGTLAQIRGPYESFLQFITDDTGNVSRIESSSGLVVLYGYDGDKLAQVRVNNGRPVRYTYNSEGRLARIDDIETGPVQFGYDSFGRVVTRMWADGSRERYEYDDATHTYRHIDSTGGISTIHRSEDKKREEIIDPLGNKTIVRFNDYGLPVSVTGPTGLTTKFFYDLLGRQTSITSPQGGVTLFTYADSTNLIKSITRPDGTRQDFIYDSRGNLLSVTERGEVIKEFSYHPDGLVKSIKGVGLAEREFVYYPNGLLKLETDLLGGTTQYEYNKRGNLIGEINSLGGKTVWSYDEQNRLVSTTDTGGGTTSYEYNAAGHCIKIIDPTGAIIRYEYDSRGRILSRTDKLGRVTRYRYDATGRLASESDPAGNVYSFQYDLLGNLVRKINPLGGITTWTYDALGNVMSETDPTGRTWQYKYSDFGLLTHIHDPSGGITKNGYDSEGQLTEVTDQAGRVTHYEYDRKGRVTKARYPDGVVETYGYDRRGNPVSEMDNRGMDVRYEYDALDRVIKEQTGKRLEISYKYDSLDNLLQWQDNLGDGITLHYNSQGLISSRSDSTGSPIRHRYDLYGRLLEVTNPLGHAVHMAYNAEGELIQKKDPSGDTIKYEYTPSGNLSTIRHPGGGITKFNYDQMGNGTEITNPLEASSRSVYDEAGRLISETDPKGQTTTFVYDRSGRLARKRLSDGKIVSYRYNAAGNLIEVDDGSFPVRYIYSPRGLLTAIEYPTIKRNLKYEYDDAGLLSMFTDSEGGGIYYEYNDTRLLSTIIFAEGKRITMAYDPKDRLTAMAYPNGLKAVREYDVLGRITQMTHSTSSGESISGRKYSYDADGNVIKTIDEEGKSTTYSYDASGRLLAEDDPEGKIRYNYLAGGNRGSLESRQQNVRYRYNEADQLLEAGSSTFRYDANGNLIERLEPQGITIYQYDTENRLVKVTGPDGAEVSFGYSPTGERIWRRDSAGLTWFVTDGTHVITELDENLKPKVSYLHAPGIDRPLVMLTEGNNYFYHADLLGSISALTDDDGKVSASYRTDAFGKVLEQKGTIPNPFIFTGREFDQEIGLYYYRARYYDPALGRFLSQDPEWGPAKLNPYIYALNAPTRYRDPLGLTEESALQQLKEGLLRAMTRRNRLQAPPSSTPEVSRMMAERYLKEAIKDCPPDLKGKPLIQILRNRYASDLKSLKNILSPQQRRHLLTQQEIVARDVVAGRPPEPTPSPQSRAAPGGGRGGLSHTRPGTDAVAPQDQVWRGRGSQTGRFRGPGGTVLEGGGGRGPGGTRVMQGPGTGRPTIGTRLGRSLKSAGRGMKRFVTGKTGRVMEIVKNHPGKIALTISAAQFARCRSEGKSNAQCIKEAAIAAGIGHGVGKLIVVLGPKGAIVVAAIGAAYGGYKIYEAGSEMSGAIAGGLERDRILAERAGQIENMINGGQLDDMISNMRAMIKKELKGPRDDFQKTCLKARKHIGAAKEKVQNARQQKASLSALIAKINSSSDSLINLYQDALAKKGKIDAINAKMADYENRVIKGIDYASNLAQQCQTEEDATKIKELYASAKGLAQGMRQKWTETGGLNQEMKRLKTKACAVNEDVGKTRKTKKNISDIAATFEKLREKARPDFDKAYSLRNALTEKCNSMLGRVSSLFTTFTYGLIEYASLMKTVENKLNPLRAHVESFRNPRCKTPNLNDIDTYAAEVKLINEDASGLLQNMGKVDTKICNDMPTADGTIGKIETSAALAWAWVGKGEGLPQMADECIGAAKKDDGDGDKAREDMARRYAEKERNRTGEVEDRRSRDLDKRYLDRPGSREKLKKWLDKTVKKMEEEDKDKHKKEKKPKKPKDPSKPDKAKPTTIVLEDSSGDYTVTLHLRYDIVTGKKRMSYKKWDALYELQTSLLPQSYMQCKISVSGPKIKDWGIYVHDYYDIANKSGPAKKHTGWRYLHAEDVYSIFVDYYTGKPHPLGGKEIERSYIVGFRFLYKEKKK
jgi:RHS repeat-associated protein